MFSTVKKNACVLFAMGFLGTLFTPFPAECLQLSSGQNVGTDFSVTVNTMDGTQEVTFPSSIISLISQPSVGHLAKEMSRRSKVFGFDPKYFEHKIFVEGEPEEPLKEGSKLEENGSYFALQREKDCEITLVNAQKRKVAYAVHLLPTWDGRPVRNHDAYETPIELTGFLSAGERKSVRIGSARQCHGWWGKLHDDRVPPIIARFFNAHNGKRAVDFPEGTYYSRDSEMPTLYLGLLPDVNIPCLKFDSESGVAVNVIESKRKLIMFDEKTKDGKVMVKTTGGHSRGTGNTPLKHRIGKDANRDFSHIRRYPAPGTFKYPAPGTF